MNSTTTSAPPMPAGTSPASAALAQPAAGPGAVPRGRWWQIEITPKRLSREELMNFSRQTASFLRAGVPILDALAIVGEDEAPRRLRVLLAEVAVALRSGRTLSAALADHKDFPEFYVSMVRSAELSGRLDVVLDELAGYLERDIESRRKIKSALTYPTIVMFMAIGAVGMLVGWVLPKFESFFDQLDATLPLPTRMLLGAADGFLAIWPLLAGGVAIAVIGSLVALRTPAGRYGRDALLLKLPALSIVVRYTVVERFCRILSAMVQAGVPLPDAVAVSANSTGNRVFMRALDAARDAMIRGEGLARPIAETGVFPAGANQMIRVGETTGTLDQQLLTAATFYQRELDYRLKRLTDLFEPAVILAVGLIVGFVAIALVSAMYGVFGQVQG